MNTFLPYESFKESARSLDRARLGKQRLETLQLLQGHSPNHPCAIMWDGFTSALATYGILICDEWIARGYEDSIRPKIMTYLGKTIEFPAWLGDRRFHDSHKSNLLRKDPVHYGKFGWDVPNDLPYVWPTNHDPRLFLFQVR